MVVYAGYVSAKLPPPKPTEQEAAVQAVKSLESLEIIAKLVYNAAIQPKEPKFRSIKLTNPKIQSLVVEVPGALDALKALGWAHDEADAELLTIQAGKYMTMGEHKVLQAAIERLKKDLKDQQRLGSSKDLAGVAASAAASSSGIKVCG